MFLEKEFSPSLVAAQKVDKTVFSLLSLRVSQLSKVTQRILRVLLDSTSSENAGQGAFCRFGGEEKSYAIQGPGLDSRVANVGQSGGREVRVARRY